MLKYDDCLTKSLDINNFKNISPYIVYIIYNILKEKIEFEDMQKLYYDIELLLFLLLL